MHAIELRRGKGAQMARSAGTQAQLVAKEGEYALLKLPSGETRKVLAECMATIGQVGNTDHENVSIGKAGTQPLEGHSSHQPRRHHEPGGSSARRRRRQDFGRPSSGDPVGPANKGRHERECGIEQHDPAARGPGELPHGPSQAGSG